VHLAHNRHTGLEWRLVSSWVSEVVIDGEFSVDYCDSISGALGAIRLGLDSHLEF
jgi:hypothetical protein